MAHGPGVIIRAASGNDAEHLAAIHAASFETAWDAAAFRSLLTSQTAVALLATSDEEPTGFVLAHVVADEAEILSLAVLAEARRCGIGRALLSALEAHAASRGAAVLHLEVAAGNTAARALYCSLGYGETGRRHGYYGPDAAGDALRMAKQLAPRSV
jgi:ribosomal-protein-alanine N-acetyltransferase